MPKPVIVVAAVVLIVAGCLHAGKTSASNPNEPTLPSAHARLSHSNDGRNWPGYGRTYGEQHFSPLAEVHGGNIRRLGLAWFMDLPPGNSATQPVAVDGTLYFALGYSRVHAVEAASGKLLWEYDPKAAEASGIRLRQGWGSRGIA